MSGHVFMEHTGSIMVGALSQKEKNEGSYYHDDSNIVHTHDVVITLLLWALW